MSDDIRLEWAVDSIIVGARHRKDLGDIDALADSINRVGLLQLPTVTPDGVLICGARRVAAIKQLGWRTVNVWVRTELSSKLSALMAERDDVVSHKDYSKIELAKMYEELKAEFAADAARRQDATKFTTDNQKPLSDGIADSATPSRKADDQATGDSRIQAARMLGGSSHYTMEHVLAIKQIANDETRDPAVRQMAAEAIQRIDEGGPVEPEFVKLRSLVRIDELDQVATDPNEPQAARDAAKRGAILLRKLTAEHTMSNQELDRAAKAAFDRVNAGRGGKEKAAPSMPRPPKPAGPKYRSAKSFMFTWTEMDRWPSCYDPKVIAQAVPDDNWLRFKQTMGEGIEFMETVDGIRAERAFAEE
jgi:ParB family chromosome partitioning protein